MLSVNKIVPLFIMWPVLSMYVASVIRVVCEHGMVPMFIMSPKLNTLPLLTRSL
jgi:hypothetical protein